MILTCMMALSCSTGSNNVSETDSMNGIDESNGIMDTAVGPNPNGYAPPNADIDTSQYRKDSIKARDSAAALQQ
ncbi:MAG: hypothetical protein ACTHLB_15820 [Parafilimonas sp.]